MGCILVFCNLQLLGSCFALLLSYITARKVVEFLYKTDS